MAIIRTTAHIQSGDHLKATLNGEMLIVDIGDGLRVFCNREHNQALFDDMVEIFTPIIFVYKPHGEALTKENNNDTDTE